MCNLVKKEFGEKIKLGGFQRSLRDAILRILKGNVVPDFRRRFIRCY
jgi:hypothetical protein